MIDISNNKFSEGGVADVEEMYRGNTPLVETPYGYMTITHKLDFDERGRKRYSNFLVEYNADLSIRKISSPFKFFNSNIEFVTTMLELPNNEIAIGVTEMDDRPMMMIFDKVEFLEACK